MSVITIVHVPLMLRMYNVTPFIHLRLLYQVAPINPDETKKLVASASGMEEKEWGILSSPSGNFRGETPRIVSSVSTFVVAGLLVKEFFTRLGAILSIGRDIGNLVKVISSETALLVFYSRINSIAKRVRMFHSRPGRIYRHRYCGGFGLDREWNYSLNNSEMKNRFSQTRKTDFSIEGKIERWE